MDATNMKPAAALAACRTGMRCLGHFRFWAGLACVALFLLVTGGCGLLQKTPIPIFGSSRSKKQQAAADSRAKVQHEVMRLADQYVARVAQATDDLAAKINTGQVRMETADWKLQQATAVYITAAGENPTLNAVDMVVIATVSRMIVEDWWVGRELGEAARPLLETHRHLETNSWRLVTEVLTAEQRQELRDRIARWWRQNPGLRNIGATRTTHFWELVLSPEPTPGSTGPTTLLGVVGLDPFSNLAPAVRSIEQTRFLAERSIYYVERMPQLLRWQAELFVFQMANQPESKQVLTDANRVSRSTEVFAQTAEKLPSLVNEQREAAINQIFDRMTLEEGKLRDLLGKTQTTLGAGTEMADSVNAAIKSLDAYTRFVTPSRTNTNAAETHTNTGHKFDVRDWGEAATRIGAAARDVNTMLNTASQSTPQASQLSQQVRADAKEVLNYAFRLGLLLILILLAGLVVAGLIYRALSQIFKRNRGEKSVPD